MCSSILLLAATVITAIQGPPASSDVSKLTGLDAIVETGVVEQRYPGAVLWVGQPGKVLYRKSYGKQDYSAASAPMAMDSLFDMASISKVVATSTAAMVLLEDGKIGLDDPVAKHIPSFAANEKGDVTLRQLMTHVSGLKAYEDKNAVEKERKPDEAHSDALIRHYASLKKAYPTGSKMVYSCLNLQTTARVVEQIAGKRLEDFVRERVWKPLGMSDTQYRIPQGSLQRCAPTGVREDGSLIRGEVHDPLANYHGSDAHCPGNAGLFSSAEDLARYADMILGEGAREGVRVFRPETIRQMTTVQTPAGVESLRGLGWDVYETAPYVTPLNHTPESLVIGHTGYTGTLLWLDKHSKTYVIFLTNRVLPSPATQGKEGKAIDDLRRKICDTVLRSLDCYKEQFVPKRVK